MTTSSRASGSLQHISGPGELLQAIPYLLGFHPQESLVLVGLESGRLVVTARLDLADVVAGADVLDETIAALRAGGAEAFVAAIFTDRQASPRSASATVSESTPVRLVERSIEHGGGELLDVLLISSGRYRSLLCDSRRCCPPDGLALPDAPSSFAVAATYEGVVALPDRAALEALLDPLTDLERRAGEPILQAAERAAVAAAFEFPQRRPNRSIKRGLFAAARASGAPGWAPPDLEAVARYAVALGQIPIRDALWTAIDGGRLDGRPLWREIARRVPSPYDAAPLFLFGWAAWRAGNGALAGIAAERAVTSDPGYIAADLLVALLARGLDPRQAPRVRKHRPA